MSCSANLILSSSTSPSALANMSSVPFMTPSFPLAASSSSNTFLSAAMRAMWETLSSACRRESFWDADSAPGEGGERCGCAGGEGGRSGGNWIGILPLSCSSERVRQLVRMDPSEVRTGRWKTERRVFENEAPSSLDPPVLDRFLDATVPSSPSTLTAGSTSSESPKPLTWGILLEIHVDPNALHRLRVRCLPSAPPPNRRTPNRWSDRATRRIAGEVRVRPHPALGCWSDVLSELVLGRALEVVGQGTRSAGVVRISSARRCWRFLEVALFPGFVDSDSLALEYFRGQ